MGGGGGDRDALEFDGVDLLLGGEHFHLTRDLLAAGKGDGGGHIALQPVAQEGCHLGSLPCIGLPNLQSVGFSSCLWQCHVSIEYAFLAVPHMFRKEGGRGRPTFAYPNLNSGISITLCSNSPISFPTDTLHIAAWTTDQTHAITLHFKCPAYLFACHICCSPVPIH